MSVTILMYHALQAPPSVIATAPGLFAAQMRWLHEQRCHVISLSALVRALAERAPLPPRAVAITFDDGFASVYTEAFPILARYGFPATVFVVTGYAGQHNDWEGAVGYTRKPPAIPHYPLLTWAQVREMDAHGIEMGAHGVRHRQLDQLTRHEVEREVRDSQNALADRLGHPVELFAYPYGRYNAGVRATVADAFQGACAAYPDVVTARSDRFALPRVEVAYVAAAPVFRWAMRPGFRLYLRFRGGLRAAAAALLRRPWR